MFDNLSNEQVLWFICLMQLAIIVALLIWHTTEVAGLKQQLHTSKLTILDLVTRKPVDNDTADAQVAEVIDDAVGKHFDDTYLPWINPPHVKSKDKRTPLQLVRFDSAGYMD